MGFDGLPLNSDDRGGIPCGSRPGTTADFTVPGTIRNHGGTFAVPGGFLNYELTVNDDAQLIDQTLEGQSAAFGQLVRKYQDRLYNTVVHVVGHAEDARDIVQDALVQAFVKLDSFRRRSAFYTWLYRIAFNLAVTHRGDGSRPCRSTMPGKRVDTEPIEDGDGPAEQPRTKGTLPAGPPGDRPAERRASGGVRAAGDRRMLL